MVGRKSQTWGLQEASSLQFDYSVVHDMWHLDLTKKKHPQINS